MGYGPRYLQWEETLRRIRVVLTALVDHANISMFGGLLVRYHWVQFPDLERRGVSSVIDANSELCCSSCFDSHASIKQRELQFEFLTSDPMRLVPMDLCCVNRAIYETNCRNASQFSPAPLAIDPLQSPAITNPAPRGNGLDRGNVADKLKVHVIGIRELPSDCTAIVSITPVWPAWMIVVLVGLGRNPACGRHAPAASPPKPWGRRRAIRAGNRLQGNNSFAGNVRYHR